MTIHWTKTEYGVLTKGGETKAHRLEINGITEEQCNECLRVIKITVGVEKAQERS